MFDETTTWDDWMPTPAEYVGTEGPLHKRPIGPTVPTAIRRMIIRDALAGVDFGPMDQVMLDWFVQCGDEVARTLVSWLLRVRETERSSRTVRSLGRSRPDGEWITIPEICARLQIPLADWEEWQRNGPTPLHLIHEGEVVVRRADFEAWLSELDTELWTDGDGRTDSADDAVEKGFRGLIVPDNRYRDRPRRAEQGGQVPDTEPGDVAEGGVPFVDRDGVIRSEQAADLHGQVSKTVGKRVGKWESRDE